MTETTTTKTIYEKLAEIHALLTKGLKESGYNSFSKYSYATDKDVIDAVRQPLADRGLFLTVSQEGEAHADLLTTDKGTYSTGLVNVVATVYDGEGNTVTARASGFATDKNGDKALFKALTGARKYALRLAFNLATGDDPEVDNGAVPESGTVSFKPAAQTTTTARKRYS